MRYENGNGRESASASARGIALSTGLIQRARLQRQQDLDLCMANGNHLNGTRSPRPGNTVARIHHLPSQNAFPHPMRDRALDSVPFRVIPSLWDLSLAAVGNLHCHCRLATAKSRPHNANRPTSASPNRNPRAWDRLLLPPLPRQLPPSASLRSKSKGGARAVRSFSSTGICWRWASMANVEAGLLRCLRLSRVPKLPSSVPLGNRGSRMSWAGYSLELAVVLAV